MGESTQERRGAQRVVQPTLRVTLLGSDYERLGDLAAVNASTTGLLVQSVTSAGLLVDAEARPVPLRPKQRCNGVIWDTERPGNIPFRAVVVRVEPEEGPAERLALELTWIEPSAYMTYQQLVYGQGT
jgi:hypothetical protein